MPEISAPGHLGPGLPARRSVATVALLSRFSDSLRDSLATPAPGRASMLSDCVVRSRSVVSACLTIPQQRAVGQHNLIHTSNRQAGLRLPYINSNHIPGLQRSPAPTEQTNRCRTASFRSPMLDVSLVIFEVKKNKGVGVNPTIFRHNCVLQQGWLPRIVRRCSVMCEQRTANT
jgi:hypothetical protein